MEFQSVFSYEGPLAGVQVQTLQEESFERPQPVQAGVFADRIWRVAVQEFAAESDAVYRVTVEVAVDGS